jgi:gliding motility-associated-like protein
MTSNASCTTTPTATSNAITVSVSSVTATATAPDIGCGQTTGTITVNASGGISPYNYSINGGNTYQSSNVFSGLAAGPYTIRIKDAANCTADINVTINQTNSTLAATASAPDIACGQATGTITVSASGGTSPYSYSINAGSSYQSSNVFNGLSAGAYTIRIKDAANCTVDINVSINQSNSTLAATASAPDIACGQATGTITVNASGGNVPYSYSIDAGNTYQTSNVFNGLTPGTYLIRVKDANGCLLDLTVTLNSIGITNLQINNPSPVCAPATIDLTAAAITAGSDAGLSYTYWTDAAATNQVTNPNAIMKTGIYYIKGTAPNGCFITKPVNVNIENKIDGIRYPDLTVTPNVAITLQGRALGINYTYQWLPPDGLSTTTSKDPVFNYDKQTEYIVRITSPTGCITVDTLLVKLIPVGIAPNVFVPKAWTPNGDGHNDNLFPFTYNITQLRYFRIYNRWGKEVFETNIIGQGWDGKYNGTPQKMDVYTWVIEAITINGNSLKLSGQAVLVR